MNFLKENIIIFTFLGIILIYGIISYILFDYTTKIDVGERWINKCAKRSKVTSIGCNKNYITILKVNKKLGMVLYVRDVELDTLESSSVWFYNNYERY